VFLEIEAKLLSEAQLQQVVVEGLLRDSDLRGSVLKRISKQVPLGILHSVVKFAPKGHFLDNILDCPLLSALLVRLGSNFLHSFRKIEGRLRILGGGGGNGCTRVRLGLGCLRGYT
jgi:hypothetical protein